MKPAAFLNELQRERASAILRTKDTNVAREAMLAAIRGGFRIVEFTLTIPNVCELIAEFARDERLIVGAGTVLTIEEARMTVAAGAKFLVSPVWDEPILRAAQALDVAFMPGCATPSEMWHAQQSGAALVKLFPGPPQGPHWVKQTLGPLPMLRIVPTNGVNVENGPEYLRAGAFAVGFTASLFDPADLAAGRYDAIEQRARAMVQAVRSCD
ncbi:MAG TPA: bifunctional 4-hydroxy-2-oxoglutarate aldolase/2-dehydro-3-deoxy-phosphogluconate aldolase [Pirellulaceae bacterium]|nr:bifunctional 4-hydroxy-2-oxoglutarate aldolase/2-dehydro-3-deoxy-phosphogluconate aldolase [Pirellulaceae bacterium]